MIPGLTTRRRFSDLSEQEILALAISSEEDDSRIYRSYGERLRGDFPATAAVVQQKLGMHHGASFDIQAVCSGFVYAVATADSVCRKFRPGRSAVSRARASASMAHTGGLAAIRAPSL